MSARGHSAIITYSINSKDIRHLHAEGNTAVEKHKRSNLLSKNIFRNGEKCWQNYDNDQLAVNTRTVLAIVPPQGCEAILVEILQSKRSPGGPHFTSSFLKSE